MPANARSAPGFGRDHKPTWDVPRRQKHQTIPAVVPTRKGVNCDFIRVASPLATDLMMRMETDPRILRISSYPVEVDCIVYDRDRPKGKRTYRPAFGIAMNDGSIVYLDVVPHNIQRERVKVYARRARRLQIVCWENWGVPYALHNELSLHIAPQWPNIQTLWRHYWADDLKALMAVQQVVDSLDTPLSTLGEICAKANLHSPVWRANGHDRNLLDVDRGFSALMQLHCRGQVRLDLSRPFSDETLVTLRPDLKGAAERFKGAA
jgi:hypothetical protein